jgi:hypothetical protein
LRIPAKHVEARLNELRFPQRVFHRIDSKTVALVADREMAEALLVEDALGASGTRKQIDFLYLRKPMSLLLTTIRKTRMPIADDNRTTFKESLGNGLYVFQHSMSRCEAYSPAVRHSN